MVDDSSSIVGRQIAKWSKRRSVRLRERDNKSTKLHIGDLGSYNWALQAAPRIFMARNRKLIHQEEESPRRISGKAQYANKIGEGRIVAGMGGREM